MIKRISNWFKADQRRAVAFGNFIEYYDLFLFVHLGAMLSKQFISPDVTQSTLKIIQFMGIYMITPIAGILFSYAGDKLGRRPVLIYSSWIVLCATIFMIFLPTYDDWGVWSMVAFFTLRIVQSVGMAGEPMAAKLYAAEHIQTKDIEKHGQKFTWVVPWWTQIMSNMQEFGGLLALIVGVIIAHIWPEPTYWSYRVPFIVGAIGALFVFWLRRILIETQEFRFSIDRDHNYPHTFIWNIAVRDRNFWCYVLLSIYVPFFFVYNFIYLSPHILKDCGAYSDTALLWHNLWVSAGAVCISTIVSWLVKKYKWSLVKTQLYSYALCAIVLLVLQEISFIPGYIWFYRLLQALLVVGYFWNILYGNLLRTFSTRLRFRTQSIGAAIGRSISFIFAVWIIPIIYEHYDLLGLSLLSLAGLLVAAICVSLYIEEDNRGMVALHKYMKAKKRIEENAKKLA